MPKVVSYFTFSFLLFKFLVTFLLSFVQKLRKMRTHLTLTYFLSPSFSKIIFIAFISFHFAPCFTQDTLHEFKACGVKNYYNGRALANIFYPKIGRRPKLDSTIGMNSLEYNFLKINQSDHRVAIMKEDHFDHFSALNKIETVSLDYHINDRNISVWYDCPQEDINWENYRFPCGSKQGKQGRTSYVFETSGQIGGCKMKMEVAVMINGSEGGMNKTRPALVVGKARSRWFSFGYKILYLIQGLEGKKNGMALLEKDLNSPCPTWSKLTRYLLKINIKGFLHAYIAKLGLKYCKYSKT